MTAPGMQWGQGTRLRYGTLTMLPAANTVEWNRPGTYYWTPPLGVQAIYLVLCGSGAGGGSGRLDVTSTAKGGGAGGGGGGVTEMWIPMQMGGVGPASNDYLWGTWTITIPAGGLGGASVSGAAANGNAGASGGHALVTFGRNLVEFRSSSLAAGGGAGGTATTATAGSAASGGRYAGGAGAAGVTAGGAGASPSLLSTFGATGGGSGGGVSAANAENAGGSGGQYNNVGTGLFFIGTVAAGGAARINGDNGIIMPLIARIGGGGGGGGGSNNNTIAGGGGNAVRGGGGGGGGAGLASTGASGPGGNGGDGFAAIHLIW